MVEQDGKQNPSKYPASSGPLQGKWSQRLGDLIRREGKAHLCALCAVVLIGVALRLSFLSVPMRYDEAWTFIEYGSKPYHVVLSDYSNRNNHIFHTFLVHVAYSLMGNKPWVIRLPALFAGVLVMLASYGAMRALYGRDVALLTAGLAASSSALVEYSTNARGFIFICLFFLLILGVATYLKRDAGRGAWLVFSALAALGFFTIPIMLYPYGVVMMWLLLSSAFGDTATGWRSMIKKLFISGCVTVLLTVILYLPVLLVSGRKSLIDRGWLFPQSFLEFLSGVPAASRLVWTQWSRDIPLVVSLLLVLGFAISTVLHKKLSAFRVPLVLVAVAWLVPVLLFHRVTPPTRTWLFLLPLFFGLGIAGLSLPLRKFETRGGSYWSAGVAVIAVALSCLLSWNVLQKQSFRYSSETGAFMDAEEIAVFLKDYLRPDDWVFVSPASHPMVKYYFMLHDIPVEYMSAEVGTSPRILLVVPDEGLLRRAGISARQAIHRVFANYSEPQRIRQFHYVSLYEINRVREADESDLAAQRQWHEWASYNWGLEHQ